MLPTSIRFRLTALLGVLFAAGSVLVVGILPGALFEREVESVAERMKGAASVAAHELAPQLSLETIDTEHLRSILQSTQGVRGVYHVSVERFPGGPELPRGIPEIEDDVLQAEGVTPPLEAVTGEGPDRSAFQLLHPVRHDGREIARLRLIASLAEAHSRTESWRRLTAVLLLLVALFATTATLGVAHLATRPLRRIAETADTIARGESGMRAPSNLGGEAGALANSFNHMVSRLETAQETAVSASRHLERILANVPAGIVLLDPDLEIVFVNEAVIGDPVRRALAPGRTPRQLLGRDNASAADRIHTLLTDCFGSRKDTEGEIRLEMDGVERSIYLRATRLDDLAPQPRLLLCALDVTGLRDAEEALRDTASELRQAQKMEAVGRLAGGVAHDFNNLLTVIGGQAQFAEYELEPTHPAFDSVEEIRQAAERATQLTSQLLAFSRRQVLAPREIDVNDVIKGVSRLLERLLGEDVPLEVDLEPRLPVIEADPGQLEQVLMNLSVNARDAMPKGGRLQIRTRRIPKPGDRPQVRISVRDEGIGMDEHTQALVFEPFFTTKEVGEGTGLGLSTVYGIVQQSQGAIHVESEVGKGTVFHIDFPGVGEPEADLPGLRPVSKSSDGADDATAQGSRKGLQILLVEDEPMVRSLILRQLTRLGHRVTAAEEPRVALERIRTMRVQPDLLITDVVMPGMSGVEFSGIARELMPDLPVLFMTGYAETEMIRVGLDLDHARLLTKPFTFEALGQAIEEVIDDVGANPAH